MTGNYLNHDPAAVAVVVMQEESDDEECIRVGYRIDDRRQELLAALQEAVRPGGGAFAQALASAC